LSYWGKGSRQRSSTGRKPFGELRPTRTLNICSGR